jgi:hypothetical protein
LERAYLFPAIAALQRAFADYLLIVETFLLAVPVSVPDRGDGNFEINAIPPAAVWAFIH